MNGNPNWPRDLRVAVLLTCHNRREKTLQCLAALHAQAAAVDCVLQTFLVDDGSTDGTGASVRQQYPGARVIEGDGSLFWCGGMRLAWEVASRDDYGAYMWLNDDTVLLPGAVSLLLEAWRMSAASADEMAEEHAAIVVGCSRDPRSGRPSFGELGRTGLLPPPSSTRRLPPGHSFNGNLVLVTRAAFRRLGNLCTAYTHSFGDVDYGLRARRAGVPVLVAAGFLAECSANPPPKWQRREVPLRERWRVLHSPKGYPPREAAAFFRQMHGWTWPLWVARVYWRVLRPKQPLPASRPAFGLEAPSEQPRG